jgi:hypothetical protein
MLFVGSFRLFPQWLTDVAEEINGNDCTNKSKGEIRRDCNKEGRKEER